MPIHGADRKLPPGAEDDDVPGTDGLRRLGVERHVVGRAVGRLEHRIEAALHLVGKALARDAPDKHFLFGTEASEERLSCANDTVARGVTANRLVNLLDDVAAFAEVA
jgi:hypothetical protein